MRVLLQREGVTGVAQYLVRNPQSWLTSYRGLSQEPQFARLYKLLSAVETSAKRPLVYREGAPSGRLGEAWLMAQLEQEPSGWRLRSDVWQQFMSPKRTDYQTRHWRTQ